eukprot:CAMPEP_0172173708 /NCGR_PEP_ID=MMETSP1050-20130122/13228_1 /TAXON_ID=233186 /ORGANISM="Cryptomonas curvata, Strain CCAP979/52" /LENGTH=130 /DNA_ID=CAMNT_0012845541 /DNA_START=80 /DNA_END=472 /DNA_ORIENTATION=+
MVVLYSSPVDSQTSSLDEAAAAGSVNVDLDFDKNTKASAELALGDQFTVTLASNPTTGYTWEISKASALLKKVDSKYIPTDSQPGLVGGGGKDVYTFKTVGTGPGEIIFSYKRSWEAASLSEATFSFDIK